MNAGLRYIGAGNNEEEARQAEVVEIGGEKFAFLAYAYPNDNSVATENRAGIATMDIDKMIEDVSRLTEEGNIVIVNMHAGIEYVTEPNWQQEDFAHAAIVAGAEAVIGHHPHWPQIIEFYQDKPIIYSLGNLVFDQMWSLETRQGLLAKMFWRDGWERIEIIPIKIYDYGQPEIVRYEEERKEILEKIGLPNDGVIKIQKEVITINSEEK
jgi:poly-gamma-glutamate synthesis protein (capsule biosynthesis protein)